jgi:hypothetical protein
MDVDGLTTVDGLGIPVWTSPGTEERAHAIAARAVRAHAWLSDTLAFRPRVRMCAVGPRDWSQVTEFPVFGFPHFVGDDTIVVGAEPAPFFDDLLDTLWPRMSDPAHRRLRGVYGEPPGLHRFAELLVIHELAHLYHVQAGYWFPQRWLSELFSNLALEGWISDNEPHLGEVLRTFPACASTIDPTIFAVRELSTMDQALEAGPTGPLNYAWYQQLLHVAATSIWRDGGATVLRRLFDRFRDRTPAEDLRTTLHNDVHPALAAVIDTWPAGSGDIR